MLCPVELRLYIYLLLALFMFFQTNGITKSSNNVVLEENTILSCNNSGHVIKIIKLLTVKRQMKCENSSKNHTISNSIIEELNDICNKKYQCQINRNVILEEDTDLNSFGYYNLYNRCRSKNDQQEETCISLTDNNSFIPTCDKSNNLNLTFDPYVTQCTELYDSITQMIEKNCSTKTGLSKCTFDMNGKIHKLNRSECFRKYDVLLEFTCEDTNEFPISSSENDNWILALGISLGVIAGCVSIVILALAFIVKRRGPNEDTDELVKENKLSDRHGHQRSISPTIRTSYASYELPQEPGMHSNNRHADKKNTSTRANTMNDNYFILEKQSEQYEMAQPVVDSNETYSISDTEFANSGQPYHPDNDNSNVYAHTVDNEYDSSGHVRKKDDSGNLYDHFDGRKSDDYDISRR